MAPKRLLLGLGLAFTLALSPAVAEGQAISRADSAAVLLAAANRFEQAGRTDVAAALFREILSRYGDTAAADAARVRLASGMDTGTPGAGRAELVVWTTLYGLWLGLATPGALGAEDPEPVGLGLLLGGPAGLFSGLSIAKRRGLTEGQARAITFGGTWGTWQGFGWAEVLDFGEGLECDGDLCTSDSSEERFTAMIAGGLTGIVVGGILSKKAISPGVATSVNFGALWGTWFGLAGSILADVDETDNALSIVLLSGNAGLLTTAILAPRWNVSRPRARIVSISGVLGGLIGAGIDLLAQPNDEKVAVAIPLATSIGGLILGARATRNYDRPDLLPAGRDGGDFGAMLRLEDGRWSMGTPMPMPTWLPIERDGRRTIEPAARVDWIRLRF